MKTSRRFSRASGSTKRRIERMAAAIIADAEARRRCPVRAWPMPQAAGGHRDE